MRMIRPFTVIAAAALVISGTAVAVGAAGESDTVQLCRTTKRLASVPEDTVTWPTDGTCPEGAEPFDVAAPSAATALGERLTDAEAAIMTLEKAVAENNAEIDAELARVEGLVRGAHPVRFGMEVTQENKVYRAVTLTGSGLKPGHKVLYWDKDEFKWPMGVVDEDGRYSWSGLVPCNEFPIHAETVSALGDPVVTSHDGIPCSD